MKTRYEIEVTRMRDGRLRLKLYDDYWDNIHTAILDTGFKSPALAGPTWMHKVFSQTGAELAKVEPGHWYALRTPDYPFGTPTELVRIPGRHMIYTKV